MESFEPFRSVFLSADVGALLLAHRTARLRGLDPGSFLRQAMVAALREPGSVTVPL